MKAGRKLINLSIRKKIFIVLLLVSMIPVVLVTFLAMQILQSALYDQIIQSGKTGIDYMRDRLELTVKDYADCFYKLEVDKQFKKDILTWCEDSVLEYDQQWRIISALNVIMSVDGRLNSIELLNDKSGQVLEAQRAGAQLKEGGATDVWTARGEGLQTNTVFRNDGDEILVLHQMNRFETGEALVTVVLHVRYSAFERLLDGMRADERETVILFNDENNYIASAGSGSGSELEHEIAGKLDSIKTSKTGSLYRMNNEYLFSRPISNKLYVVRAVPEEIIAAASKQTLGTGILVGLLCLAAAFVLSAVMSRVISHPIVDLAGKMKTVMVDDFAADADIKRTDEIGLLQDSFQSMILRNQELINREYRSKLEKQRAQLQALKAQINPHFLHNTLQVIGGMALEKNAPEVYSTTVALSDIMRYALNFSREMVPISEELEYLKSYMFIQNQRFKNRITVDINIPEDIKNFLIPELILQPIIENSFEHGLPEKQGPWSISITGEAKPEGDIILRVRDNGVGIEEDKLKELRDLLAGPAYNIKEHIGLMNVNARLMLIFQEGYGLSIFSEQGEGTTVEVRLKAVKEEMQ